MQSNITQRKIDISETVLGEAWDIVGPIGDREKTYGHPAKNLLCIAGMWEHYLYSRGLINADGEGITPQDVAVMMTLLKCARLANQPDHHDSLVDAAGYIALVERCRENPDD